MTLDSNDAKRALADIQSATEKSSALRGYVAGGDYMILWGIVWIVGGAASLVSTDASRWGWTIAVVAGVIGSIALGLRARSRGFAARGTLGKVLATMLAMALVSVALSVVLNIDSAAEATALQTLIVAGAYMTFGAWRGIRIFVLGLALGIGVLIAWFYMRDQFGAVVGLLGGALLILSGIGLRRA